MAGIQGAGSRRWEWSEPLESLALLETPLDGDATVRVEFVETSMAGWQRELALGRPPALALPSVERPASGTPHVGPLALEQIP